MQKQLFDQLDGPCSALLLNCGQFGCCIANVAEFEYGIENCATWMTQLSRSAPDLYLRDLVIPGTHDSATCSISKLKPFSAAGRTQNVSIYEQLQRGVRYLDLRVAGNGSAPHDVFIRHGALSGGKFVHVLDEIVKYMTDYPGEFLFLHIVAEYGQGFTPEQRKYTLDVIQEKCGMKLYGEQNFKKLMHGTTLDEIVQGDASCAVLLHNRIYKDFVLDRVEYKEDNILEQYGYFNSARCMFDKWHNTREVNQLLEWNLEEVQRHATHRNKLLCNQVLLTPGVGGVSDVLSLLIGQVSLRPVTFASSLYKRDVLDNYLRLYADEKWNLLKLDFVDLIPALLGFLISLNFTSKLNIQTAAVNAGSGAIDVTDKIQQYVKRDKVLFLTNVQDDLELDFDEGTLTIAYTLQDAPKVFEVEFDAGTEIVLSEYSHNEGGTLVHVDQTPQERAPHQRGGVVVYGSIMSREEYSPSRAGTAIAYTADPDTNATVFSILD